MFGVDEILLRVDQLVVVYVRSRQIWSMLEKLRLRSVQCKIGQCQRGYTIPSIVRKNKKGIDSSPCRRGG